MLLRLTTLVLTLGIATVAYAESQRTPEALGREFDTQVARLVERGYPALFGDQKIFDETMAKLRKEALQYVPAKPWHTFLIVVPFRCAPLPWQIKKVILPSGETCNLNDWNLSFKEDVAFHPYGSFTTPDEPYLIYDMDLGDHMIALVKVDHWFYSVDLPVNTIDRWVCDVLMELPRVHRRGLTIEECVALLVQRPELLSNTRIAAIGTIVSYGGAGSTFVVWKLHSWGKHDPYVSDCSWNFLNDPQKSSLDWYSHFQFPNCRE